MRTVISGTGLIVVALAATLVALVFPVWSYADRSGTGQAKLDAASVPTRWGPLSAADRDFLVRVKRAGLWELPAGQQAIERAPTRAVVEAGEHLVEGHTFLDARVREVAAQLGMELPSQPTEEQQGWLREFTEARGAEYEWKFANILRRAHGKVFALVAQIRDSTRNSLVRRLAEDANTTVLDHITMLEATGQVDFDAIAANSPGTPPPSPVSPPGGGFPLPPPATRPKEQTGPSSPTS
ncbi:DUF4142 domain-containing protein [Streptomyces sannanensis]|uniref:DUF4142 domain-containing protein n=1 Tax=Streptomyces sannanensis TaxID=285536 RepID=A0ABP6SI38_9ACTN